MSEVDTAMNLMFKAANMILDYNKFSLNICNMLVKPLDRNPVNTMWKNAVEQDKVDVITYRDSKDAQEIKEQLRKNNVPYKEYKDMIFTLTQDRDRIKTLFPDNEIPIEEAIKENSELSTIEISVDESEALMFMNKLKQNDVIFAVTQDGYSDNYKIVVADKDKDILNRIRLDIAVDKQGEYGNIIKRETKKDAEYKIDMLNAVGSSNKENCDVIIADSDGTVIQGNEKFVVVEKNGKDETFYKSKDLGDVETTFNEMKIPTKLTKEEYEQFKNAENKQDFLIDKRREQGIGNLTEKEKETVIKQDIKNRELYEQKMSQSHPEEIVADMDEYNSEQPLILYKESERENYEMDHDIEESQFIDGTILNDAVMDYRGYEVEDSETDYDAIAEAEEEIFNGREMSKEDMEIELSEKFGLDIDLSDDEPMVSE